MAKQSDSEEKQNPGLIEYALILVLVSVVITSSLMLLGPIIGNVFSTINNSLSGIGGTSIVATTPDVSDSAGMNDTSTAKQLAQIDKIFSDSSKHCLQFARIHAVG